MMMNFYQTMSIVHKNSIDQNMDLLYNFISQEFISPWFLEHIKKDTECCKTSNDNYLS